MQSIDTLVRALRVDLGAEPVDAATPRFELFHAANSICSQKVRTVLAHHAIGYAAHTVSLFTGQTYLPSHVRLRVLGCAPVGALAVRHDGSTSASESGCDAAVVPTLVDWQTGEVIVDSKRICLHLDATMPPGQQLRPAGLAAAIDAELAVVDNLPNYQMLMGRAPGAATARGGSGGPDFSLSKVARCDAYMAEFADEPALVQAYAAKRAKELDAAGRLFSAEAMAAAYAAAERALQRLDAQLQDDQAQQAGPWLFGAVPTLADVFWMVELLRMQNLGADVFWTEGRLPQVARLATAAASFPATRTAVLEWPGALF